MPFLPSDTFPFTSEAFQPATEFTFGSSPETRESQVPSVSVDFEGVGTASVNSDILCFPTGGFLQPSSFVYLTDELDDYAVDYWPPHVSRVNNEYVYSELTSVQPITSAHRSITAWLAPGYKQDYYYRIHITPSVINFGSLLSEQTRDISVWNAWDTPKFLSQIIETGTSNVALVGPDAPPTTFAAYESRSYTVTVDQEGPPTLTARFNFAFPNETPFLRLEGVRVTFFPIAPNWKTPIKERLEWLTEVLEARKGNEQRIRQRQNPKQTMEYEALLLPETLPLFGSLMFGWQTRQWGYPLWFHVQKISSGVAATGTIISCVTEGYEFFVGGYAVLYLSPFHAESFKIKTMTANTLESAVPLTSAWPIGTELMPMRFGYIQEATSSEYINGEVSNATIQFVSEQHKAVAPTSWPHTYEGYPVLEVEPNWEGTRQERWQGTVDVFETQIGNTLRVDRTGYAKATRNHRLTALNRAKILAYRNILNYAQGRWKEFWAPSFNRDIFLTEDILASQNWLTVRFMSYAVLVKQHTMRRDLWIVLRTGQTYYRRITSSDAVNTPAGTERLFLNAPIPVNISAHLVFISFMTLSRLDADAVEIDWITPDIMDTVITTTGAPA